jgi:hypothetical protein
VRPPVAVGSQYNTGLVRLPDRLADFRARGFRGDCPEARAILEGHARNFLLGFNLALRHRRDVHAALATVPAEERGFAYEGAGMLAGFLDAATAGRAGMLARLLEGPGDGYIHLLHVGYGWPPAPLRIALPAPLPATPLLRWLAIDGAGFADVFFGGKEALRRLAGGPASPQRAVRLAGAGRALWFAECAVVNGVAGEIGALPLDAQADVWAGIGLACSYAGCVGPDQLDALAVAAGVARRHFLQGVMFAAAARSRSGTVPEHTRVAAVTLLGAEPAVVAGWTDEAARDLCKRTDLAAYALWRIRLQARATTLASFKRAEAQR